MSADRKDCSPQRQNENGLNFYQQNQMGLLSETVSPLQREFKKHELKSYVSLNRISYAPFMDSGDATNRVILDLSEVSPTQAACKNLYVSYMQANETLELQRNSSLFGNSEAEISKSEKANYENNLFAILGKSGIENLKNSIKREIENYLIYGNMLCEIILLQVGKEKIAQVIAHDFNYFRYELPNQNEGEIGDYGYLCEDFLNVNYNANVQYQRYSMYPNFTEHEDGSFRCLLHSFTPTAGRQWYGVPFHFAGIYAQFLEFQMGKYTSLAMDNKFLSSLIIEREEREQDIKSDDEKAAQIADEARKIKQIYGMAGVTNLADKSPIIVLERPTGATPSVFKDIPNNLDADFYGLIFEQTRNQIMLSWRVHSGLLQQAQNALSGGNLFAQVANEFYWTQIKSAQDKAIKGVNLALNKIFEWAGYDNQNLSLSLPIPYFIDKLAPQVAAPSQNENFTIQ